MTQTKNSHHHGNLRSALIDAGVDLIREGGPNALSIRKTAARAGVSHAAPAHHFAKLEDLKIAVVARGFGEFTKAMEEEISNLAPDTVNDPRSIILAACKGYISFAQQNPSLYELMFSSGVFAHTSEELEEASSAAYGVLAQISSLVIPGPSGPRGIEALIWSLVHGFASLSLANKIGFDSDELAFRQFESIFPDLPYRNTSTDQR